MASLESELLSKIHGLLKEGRVGEASTALAQHYDANPAPAAGAPTSTASAAPARPTQSIFVDIVTGIVNHLGAPPALQALLDELLASL